MRQLALLIAIVLGSTVSAQGPPDLSGVSPEERRMIDGACSTERAVGGPAAYYRCLNDQLTQLRAAGAPPDVSGVSLEARRMIDGACSTERAVGGPAAYYQCVNGEVRRLRAAGTPPDVSGVSPEARRMIDGACSTERAVGGPAAYYQCVNGEVRQLQAAGTPPDVSNVSPEARRMIDGACSTERAVGGPAAYYRCLRSQLTALGVNVAQAASPRVAPVLQTAEVREPSLAAPASEPQPVSAAGPATLRSEAISIEVDQPSAAEPPVLQSGGVTQVPPAPRPSPSSTQGSRNAANTSSPIQFTPADQARRPLAEGTPTSAPVAVVLPANPRPGDESDGGVLVVTAFVIGLFFYFNGKAPCDNCGTNKKRYESCSVCSERAAAARAQQQRAAEAERQRAETEHRKRHQDQQREQDEQRRRQQEEERRRFTTIDGLNGLTGHQFESLIESTFERDGYVVDRVGGAGDDGIDLILRIGAATDVVQCKRWKADVGPAVVREFYGSMIHAGARYGFIVTTARFTQAARGFTQNKPITLLDGQTLLSWLSGSFNTQRNASSTSSFDPFAELQIPRDATEAQVKTAYRNLMIQYHPDRVAGLGPEIQDFAKRKAQSVNRAYEAIRKMKGWS